MTNFSKSNLFESLKERDGDDGSIKSSSQPNKSLMTDLAEDSTSKKASATRKATYIKRDKSLETLSVFNSCNIPTVSSRDAEPEVVDKLVEQLLSYDIRDRDYAQVALGRLSYTEYLKMKPGLLMHKKASTVLRGIVGYKRFGVSIPKAHKILTMQILMYHTRGDNKEHETFLETTDYVPEPRKYLDNAVKRINDYYDYIKEKAGFPELQPNDTQSLIIMKILLLMSHQKFTAGQMAYAILRPTHPQRRIKQMSIFQRCLDVIDFEIFDVAKSSLKYLLDHGVEDTELHGLNKILGDITRMDHKLMDYELESLVCPVSKTLGKLTRMNNLIYTLKQLLLEMSETGKIDLAAINAKFDDLIKICPRLEELPCKTYSKDSVDLLLRHLTGIHYKDEYMAKLYK